VTVLINHFTVGNERKAVFFPDFQFPFPDSDVKEKNKHLADWEILFI